MAKRILVADSSNSRIVILESPDMTFVSAFGSYGTGDGEFGYPTDAFSNAVNIFATDAYGFPGFSHSVQKFDMAGNFIARYGDQTINSDFGFGDNEFSRVPWGIVADGSRIYVSDRYNHLLRIIDLNTFTLINMIGRYDWTITDFGLFCDGAAAYGGMLYIQDANADGALLAVQGDNTFAIKHGAPFNDSTLSGGGNYADSTHIYAHSKGGSRNGVYKYHRLTLLLDLAFPTPFTYSTGGGICGDSTHVYVLQGSTQLTKRLKSDLTAVATYPLYNDARDFGLVYGCAVDNTYVYVCDYTNHRIVRVDKATLTYHSEFDIGAQHGWPQHIAIDSTYAYIMSFGATVKVAKYDIATWTLQTLSTQDFTATGTHYLALDAADPDNSLLYVFGQYDSTVFVLDRATLTVQYTSGSVTIADNALPEVSYISLTPDYSKIVVSYLDYTSTKYDIKVFDTTTRLKLGQYTANNWANTPLVCYSNTEFFMWNDNTYTLELRNITTFVLIDSITLSIANGFPADAPSIYGIGYDPENNKIFLSETNSGDIWRLNGTTLAFEAASSGLGLSFPINIQIYDTAPPVTVTKSMGQVIW